jgi:hypothetical protein
MDDPTPFFFAGDRVIWCSIHGEVTAVFEGVTRENTIYRVALDGGGCCHNANVYEMSPEPPLETLARAFA